MKDLLWSNDACFSYSIIEQKINNWSRKILIQKRIVGCILCQWTRPSQFNNLQNIFSRIYLAPFSLYFWRYFVQKELRNYNKILFISLREFVELYWGSLQACYQMYGRKRCFSRFVLEDIVSSLFKHYYSYWNKWLLIIITFFLFYHTNAR